MSKDIIKAMIEDGKHMIHRRALRYDDLDSDKFHTIFIMDGYEDKPIYDEVDTCALYYKHEGEILRSLEEHIEESYLNRV